jgi:transcriptional antiterminator NusG
MSDLELANAQEPAMADHDQTPDPEASPVTPEPTTSGDDQPAESAPVAEEPAIVEVPVSDDASGKKSKKSKTSKTSKTAKEGKEAKTAKAAKGAETEDEPFDPAVDLPAYREGMNWFVLRVASNKESYVRETLLKKVQIEGLDILVGRIMVPTEKTKTLKGGKAKITETKLYPGYVFVEMKLEDDGRIPQDVFFLIKETTGVGDFVGTAGHPTPMAPHEVEKMLFDSRKPEETPTVKLEFAQGDAVTIQEGPFENYEGTVDDVMPDKGKVRVLVTIFGRQAPVELEYWQIAKAEEA